MWTDEIHRMPRPKSSLIHEYFKEVGKHSQCLMSKTSNADSSSKQKVDEECGEIIKGQHPTNLERHMRAKHPELVPAFLENKRLIKIRKAEKANNSSQNQSLLDDFIDCKKMQQVIKITTSLEEIEENAVTLTCVDGRPFSAVEDVSYQSNLNKKLKAMNLKQPYAMYRGKAVELVLSYAEKMRADITQLVKNRIISVKADCVTKFRRSFLGINIQTRVDQRFYCISLGVVALVESHTAEYLKRVILDHLAKFGIEEKNIYAMTTDNGANLVKLVRILNKNNEDDQNNAEARFEEDPDDPMEMEPDNDDFSIAEILENVIEVNVEQPEEIEAQLLEADILSKIDTMWQGSSKVQNIRCAAHTLQLAIYDALSACKDVEILNKVRSIVKKLRTSVVLRLLDTLHPNHLNPILENDTRWMSCYNMLERFVAMKDHITSLDGEIQNLPTMSEDEWDSVKAILSVLEAVKVATVELQKEDLTLSNAYQIWINCQLKTKAAKSKHPLAEESLQQRSEKILQSIVMKCAVFLDHRYNSLIENSNDEIFDHLSQLQADLIKLQQTAKPNEEVGIETAVASSSSSANPEVCSCSKKNGNEFSDFIKSMREKKQRKLSSSASSSNSPSDVSTKNAELILELKSFYEADFKEFSEMDVLDFWSQKRIQVRFPNIYELVPIIFSVPGTQCSVERLFSDFSFIFNKYRSKLGAALIDSILLLRFNYRINNSFNI